MVRRVKSRKRRPLVVGERVESQMSDLSGDPVIPFGRHNGRYLSELPEEYLDWLVQNFRPGRWRDLAVGELQRRGAVGSESLVSSSPCCRKTKGGGACGIPADRNRDGKMYCHVHDPEGKFRQQGAKFKSKKSKPGKNHVGKDGIIHEEGSQTHYRYEMPNGKATWIPNDVSMDGRADEVCPF